jgi:5-methylcytosine-specific restriction endonuclease McrA
MKKSKKFNPRKSTTTNKKFNGTQRWKETNKYYDNEWTKYTFRFKHYNPRCYACGSNNKIHVDHVVAHKGNEQLFWNTTNHIPLCHSCHSFVTASFDRYSPPLTEAKMIWIDEQRKLFKTTIKVKVIQRKK